jgi:hypothetical protein
MVCERAKDNLYFVVRWLVIVYAITGILLASYAFKECRTTKATYSNIDSLKSVIDSLNEVKDNVIFEREIKLQTVVKYRERRLKDTLWNTLHDTVKIAELVNECDSCYKLLQYDSMVFVQYENIVNVQGLVIDEQSKVIDSMAKANKKALRSARLWKVIAGGLAVSVFLK